MTLFWWWDKSDKPEKPAKPLLTWEDGWRQGMAVGKRDVNWDIEMRGQTWLYQHKQEFHPEPKPDVF